MNDKIAFVNRSLVGYLVSTLPSPTRLGNALGFIKTNIGDNRVTAKKSQDANSPYSEIMQQMVSYIGHVPFSPHDVVAKAVLKAVTSENPSLWYLAGKDGLKISTTDFHRKYNHRAFYSRKLL
jgi:hypothetical protein